MNADEGAQRPLQDPANEIEVADISWMFDEDDAFLEEALAAPEDDESDPYYFVQARKTGMLDSLCAKHEDNQCMKSIYRDCHICAALYRESK